MSMDFWRGRGTSSLPHAGRRKAHAARLGARSSATGALLALLLLGGCTLLIDSNEEQCTTNEDCAGLVGAAANYSCVENYCVPPMCVVDDDCSEKGAAFADTICVNASCVPEPKWGCLSRPPMPSGLSGPFHVKLHVQHIVTQMPMAAVTARVCRKLDLECERPDSIALSDDNGDVFVDIPTGFTGYVFFTREAPGIMSTLYFFNPPIDRDQTLPPIQLGEPVVANGLAARAGITQAAERGMMLLASLDCAGGSAMGLRFEMNELDASTSVFYAAQGFPSTLTTATDSSGFGGFLNAPTGIVTVSAYQESEGRLAARISVLVKANAMTISRLSPLGPR